MLPQEPTFPSLITLIYPLKYVRRGFAIKNLNYSRNIESSIDFIF